jgi:hypothetical protein
MTHPLIDSRQGKPTVTVSIPPEKRAAFYEALLCLRQRYGDPFSSMSSLIVDTVIIASKCPQRHQEAEEHPQ